MPPSPVSGARADLDAALASGATPNRIAILRLRLAEEERYAAALRQGDARKREAAAREAARLAGEAGATEAELARLAARVADAVAWGAKRLAASAGAVAKLRAERVAAGLTGAGTARRPVSTPEDRRAAAVLRQQAYRLRLVSRSAGGALIVGNPGEVQDG